MIQSPEEKIVKYIAKHAWRESIFETPMPQWYIGVVGVLDCIADSTGLSKETISTWVDEAQNEGE